MGKIILIKPTKEYEEQAKEFIQEFIDHNSEMHGVGDLNLNLDSYDEWLKRLDDYSRGINLKEGHVPATTFFAINQETNEIIGMIDIRHNLNDYLLERGGHIGYSVRPSERKQGYATEILYLGLGECVKIGLEKVLITCYRDNIASAKTIQNNFGVLENEILGDGNVVQRYWIDVTHTLKKKEIKNLMK